MQYFHEFDKRVRAIFLLGIIYILTGTIGAAFEIDNLKIDSLEINGFPCVRVDNKFIYKDQNEPVYFELILREKSPDHLTLEFIYQLGDTEFSESIKAPYAPINSPLFPDLEPYPDSTNLMSYIEVLKSKGYMAPREYGWNTNEEKAKALDNGWTPTVSFSALQPLAFGKPFSEHSQESQKTSIYIPYGFSEEEFVGNLGIYEFPDVITNSSSHEVYYCPDNYLLIPVKKVEYSLSPVAKEWLNRNKLEIPLPDKYERLERGQPSESRILKGSDKLKGNYWEVISEGYVPLSTPYIYATGQGQFYIGAQKKVHFKKADNSQETGNLTAEKFKGTLLEKTAYPLYLPPKSSVILSPTPFRKGFYYRNKYEIESGSIRQDWVEESPVKQSIRCVSNAKAPAFSSIDLTQIDWQGSPVYHPEAIKAFSSTFPDGVFCNIRIRLGGFSAEIGTNVWEKLIVPSMNWNSSDGQIKLKLDIDALCLNHIDGNILNYFNSLVDLDTLKLTTLKLTVDAAAKDETFLHLMNVEKNPPLKEIDLKEASDAFLKNPEVWQLLSSQPNLQIITLKEFRSSLVVSSVNIRKLLPKIREVESLRLEKFSGKEGCLVQALLNNSDSLKILEISRISGGMPLDAFSLVNSIQKLTRLEKISIQGNVLSNGGVVLLAKALPCLKNLNYVTLSMPVVLLPCSTMVWDEIYFGLIPIYKTALNPLAWPVLAVLPLLEVATLLERKDYHSEMTLDYLAQIENLKSFTLVIGCLTSQEKLQTYFNKARKKIEKEAITIDFK